MATNIKPDHHAPQGHQEVDPATLAPITFVAATESVNQDDRRPCAGEFIVDRYAC
jgi:hypothetical protein